MTRNTLIPTGRRLRAPVRNALAMATLLAFAGLAGTAQALEFGDQDGFHGSVNTTIGWGMAWRTEDAADDLIGKAQFDPTVSALGLGSAAQRAARGRYSVNGDDGNLAYDQWSPISNAINATVELSLRYGANWGAFVRGYGFYDFENNDRDDLSRAAKNRVGTQTRILDAFVFHNFSLAEREGTIRLGQQVVSWGESTFIQGGINAINPVDVSKLRVAGAELKNAFLPVHMLWSSYTFTDNFSGELVYLFDFRRTDPDPVGSYFSTNDFAVMGGRYVMLNFGTVPQPVINPDLYDEVCGLGNYAASDTSLPLALVAAGCSAAFPRTATRNPKKSGQGGFALRYLAEGLNNTEFGFYALNYHSRVPLISGISVVNSAPSSGSFFTEYPENIHLFGVSFNTQLESTGIALQGELSYRPNQPFQIDDVELLFAGLSPLNVLLPQPYLRFYSQLGQYGPGEEIRGYERHKIAQLQFTATKVLGPGNFLGSDQLAMVGEVGFTHVDLPDNLRFNGDGTDTGGGPDVNTGSGRNPITQVGGFPTRFSWGYRLAMRADYNNVWGTPVNLSPRIAFNHDVNGITPGPGGSFLDGRKSVTIGAEANYLNRWVFDLAYTNFFGGGHFNLIHDRDFVQIAARYSF
ncbi:DUF1302 domain-containing protein [Dokdonella sp.]|uniref:DUF1302 domain-containing protein n=1 Tax=Dokdonella sp. TaxID=2291710 RepID=UPI0025C19FF7|nr:DUF1302 domain-containing protein [Dokdonella sp.]MBX3691101.1 DUF1302 domain-containing protein [Dokdonella sp.]MCW5567135.1 DUF1302 domain-containing protein [Dokdonella sp.]